MPPRTPSKANDTAAATPARGNFRQRYANIEKRRVELIDRLHALGDAGQTHPGYKRALTLLNETFRKSKLTQRLAILQAAAWLIDIIERLTAAV